MRNICMARHLSRLTLDEHFRKMSLNAQTVFIATIHPIRHFVFCLTINFADPNHITFHPFPLIKMPFRNNRGDTDLISVLQGMPH